MTPQNNPNNLTEILAVIGALSWIYPLVVWLNKKFIKTELEIISHKTIEIGYTYYGPIINIDLAFSASKDDAFIKAITIELNHESHQAENFKWEWFEEKLMEMMVPEGGIVPYKRNQKAIALKVLTSTLVEKKIGFHKPLFAKAYSENYNSVFQIYQNLINKNISPDELIKSNEYNSFENLFKNNFTWKVGRYTGIVTCVVANRGKKFTKKIEFILTNADIRKLEGNISKSIVLIGRHFGISTLDEPQWDWAYPTDTNA